uniref:C2 NT-type domain-containing protein n=1 Tax=Panagrolaimus sp. ES5 TaxID=591445 RepID=A0AC34FWI9_9BILA
MTMVWKRVKRSGHQASKYAFNISFKELIIDAERKPEKVQIAVMHRRRRYACESRPLEKSFSSENKYMIVWPDLTADTVNFNTTLFKDPSKEQFDNKEWTLIAEEVTKKGKIRPLAAVQLNFAFFVNQNPDIKTELKLKLRCLQKDVNNCTLSLILSSTLVKEGNAMDDDIQSQASVSSVKIPIDIPLLSEDNEKITEGVKKITKDFEDWKDEKEEISVKPTPPPVVKQAWGEPAPTAAATTNEERRRHSRNDEPPPPLPPDDDIQSQASVSSVKIPIDIPLLPEDNEKITEGVKKITKDFEDWKDEKEEISVKPTPPPVVKQAWGEPAPTAAATTNEERRRHSRNDEPPPPLPPHRISTSRQSDSFEHDI